MGRIILSRKPLVEAIFEVRWNLQRKSADLMLDPYYRLFIGRMYERVKEEYPFFEQMPSATTPDELVAYSPQYRLRKAENRWPLIQVGPGLLTLNDTDAYVWEDFEGRVDRMLTAMFEMYPASQRLIINDVILRYIDAFPFDFERDNVFEYLRTKMFTNIAIYDRLFDKTGVKSSPLFNIDLKLSYQSEMPKGAVYLRFYRGKNRAKDALMMETMVRALKEDAPKNKEGITRWLNMAHALTDDWFFKLIENIREDFV